MLVTAIEIYEQSDIDTDLFDRCISEIDSWSCGLWWGDFEEAGIRRCYIAFDGDRPVGFQTVSGDGLCVAIEVHPEYQGQGIASALVEESNCWRPERNECPGFWAAIKEKFEY